MDAAQRAATPGRHDRDDDTDLAQVLTLVVWMPQLAGLNPAYTLMVVPYRAVFSVAVPIMVVDLLSPAAATTPCCAPRASSSRPSRSSSACC